MSSVEEIVRDHVNFIIQSDKWNRCFCCICGDGSRTKGPRGGWLFTDDITFYHCFNCAINLNFSLDREHPFSEGMYEGFIAFGVPIDEINKLIFKHKTQKPKNGTAQKPKSILNDLKIIDLSNHFYKLSDASLDDEIANNAKNYLINQKCIDPNSYDFYLSTGKTDSKNETERRYVKALYNRIIIPAFYKEKIIYYIARSLDEKNKLKYLNVSLSKNNIIYGLDKILINNKYPLFITEGFFDAHHLNGVAVLGNELSKGQIEILNKSNRPKIVVPDKNSDFKVLARKALELGWGLSCPDIGNCKDITESIKKYGKLYTIASVVKNIRFGNAAKINLEIY